MAKSKIPMRERVRGGEVIEGIFKNSPNRAFFFT